LVRYEAEEAVISQGWWSPTTRGFSGTGFVNYGNLTGSFVQWTVTATQAGSATLRSGLSTAPRQIRAVATTSNGGPSLDFLDINR